SEREKFIDEWRKTVCEITPESEQELELFIEHIKQKTLAEQQEYYISTFDVQALCYLDVGYVLYGEDYNRGVFLANMKKEQKNAGNDCGSELPDHLPNVLTLLPKMDDTSLAEELIVSMLIPAVEKMVGSFRIEGNVYQGMLKILLRVMQNNFPDSEFEKFSFTSQKKAKSFEHLPQWKDIK
ncbi:MAG: hypothetical protein WC987_05940, partial [Mariniphaga sp.]